MACAIDDLTAIMFATPTPANTPHLGAAAVSFSPEHIIIDVREADHREQGMPSLSLAPSVDKVLREKLLRSRQRNMMPSTPGSGNAENVSSILAALKLLPNSSLSDTPYRG